MNPRPPGPRRFVQVLTQVTQPVRSLAGRRRQRMVRISGSSVHTARLAVVSLVVALIGAMPSSAQAQIHDQRWTRNDDGRHFSMSVRGKVWFTDDDRDIERIEPEGRLMIEEKWRGGPDRMIIITPTPSGGVQRVYLRD